MCERPRGDPTTIRATTRHPRLVQRSTANETLLLRLSRNDSCALPAADDATVEGCSAAALSTAGTGACSVGALVGGGEVVVTGGCGRCVAVTVGAGVGEVAVAVTGGEVDGEVDG